jgi:hypothetical protein
MEGVPVPSDLPSPKFTLNSTDLGKLAVTALLMGVAAVLTFLLEHLTPAIEQLDDAWKLLIMAVLTTALKLVQKWLSGPNLGPLILLAILCWPAGTAAAEIKAPAAAEAHTLVRVTSNTAGTGFAWFISGPAGFADLQTYDGGQSAVFTGPPGRYAVMLVVAGANGKLDQGQATVVIGGAPAPGPGPTPGPGPGPGPAPEPVFPPGKFQFARLSYDEARKIAGPARQRAQAMGANYEAIAAQLAAGGLPDVPAALGELRTRNRATLGAELADWGPWALAWTERANKHNADGTLRSVADYVTALEETAQGLKAVQ